MATPAKSTSCASYVEHDVPCCRAHANHGWFHAGLCCPRVDCEDCPAELADARYMADPGNFSTDGTVGHSLRED